MVVWFGTVGCAGGLARGVWYAGGSSVAVRALGKQKRPRALEALGLLLLACWREGRKVLGESVCSTVGVDALSVVGCPSAPLAQVLMHKLLKAIYAAGIWPARVGRVVATLAHFEYALRVAFDCYVIAAQQLA